MLFRSYSFGSGTYVRFGEDVVTYENPTTTWSSIMTRKNKSLSQNNYRLNAEYKIDSLNTISGGFDGSISAKVFGENNVPTLITDANNNLISRYNTNNKRTNPAANNSFNLSFEHKFTDKKLLNFSADYSKYKYLEMQDVTTKFNFAGIPEYSERFINDNKQNIDLFSSQVDFSQENEMSSDRKSVV